MTRIYFQAIDAYAARLGLIGTDFELFRRLLLGMDDEYVVYISERVKAEREKDKPPPE